VTRQEAPADGPRRPTILIRNGYVIPGAHRAHLDRADIFIDRDRIAAIGPDLLTQATIAASNPRIIEAGQRLVIPGFINAHTHSNESFSQGFWDALPLEVWLLHKYPPFALKPLPERTHYLRTLLLAIESIRSGVTMVQDDLINRLSEIAAFDGSAAAYRDIGLRAAITTSMSDRQFLEPLPWLDELMDAAARAELATLPVVGWREHLAMFARNAGKWHGAANGRIRAILGPIGPQWCSDELLQAATEASLTRGVPLHMHALESKLQAVQAQLLYGRPIVEHLDALGVLTRNLTLNHAIWLTDGEIERLGGSGCSISHNPLSNLKLGSGVARVRDLKRAGVNVALGTDGTSTSDRADMLRSLGMAALIHRVGDMDYETWLTAEEAFEMAAVGSAGSTGLAGDIGTIEVGKKADLVLLDREDYGFIPLHRPVQQLAYAVNSDAVRTVLVDGEVVMDERVLTRIDEAALKAEMIEAANAYVRDNVATMERLAARFYPYYRAAHMRAAATDVPASRASVRLPCGCSTALRHTLTCA
jgi:5-methylthioadenosine/S-adenosylhomocysteine deaminase